jgi:hypothetical protein
MSSGHTQPWGFDQEKAFGRPQLPFPSSQEARQRAEYDMDDGRSRMAQESVLNT